MVNPVIHEAKFADKADAAINSEVLRLIFMHTRVGRMVFHNDAYPYFSETQKVWGVRIEDKHDKGEKTPHYILEFGAGDYKKCRHEAFSVTYSDYLSKLKKSPAQNTIEVNPGKYTIHLWLRYDNIETFQDFAKVVNDAYYNAMVIALPAYAILTDRMVHVDN